MQEQNNEHEAQAGGESVSNRLLGVGLGEIQINAITMGDKCCMSGIDLKTGKAYSPRIKSVSRYYMEQDIREQIEADRTKDA